MLSNKVLRSPPLSGQGELSKPCQQSHFGAQSKAVTALTASIGQRGSRAPELLGCQMHNGGPAQLWM